MTTKSAGSRPSIAAGVAIGLLYALGFLALGCGRTASLAGNEVSDGGQVTPDARLNPDVDVQIDGWNFTDARPANDAAWQGNDAAWQGNDAAWPWDDARLPVDQGSAPDAFQLADATADVTPAPDAYPSDSEVCDPDCEQICPVWLWQQDNCALAPRSECLDRCRRRPDDDTTQCMRELACAGRMRCPDATRCLAGTALPDLVVELAPGPVAPFEMALTVRACNRGELPSRSASIQIYRNMTAPPRPGQAGDRSIGLGPMAAGDCRTLAYEDRDLKPGMYRVWAQVDAADWVIESDEDNNIGGPTAIVVADRLPPGLPDLLVKGLVATTDRFTVSYSFSICNGGKSRSSGTYADLFLDAPSAPDNGRSGDQAFYIPELQAGACNELSYRRDLVPGSYRSWVQVDGRALVPETNERNNTAGPIDVVISQVALPDLVIRGFSATARAGGRVDYRIEACNVGQAAADATIIALFYDRDRAPRPTSLDRGDRGLLIGRLEPARCGQVSYSATLAPGAYLSWAYVDGSYRVAEQHEDNNLAGPTKVLVEQQKRPDLVVSKFTARNRGRGRVRFSATVCNDGGSDALPSYIALYYNSPAPPTPTTRRDQVGYLPQLQPGQCRQVLHDGVLAAGRYTSWLFVDYFEQLEEADERNNIAGPEAFVVEADGQPDLQINKFEVEANGDYVDYTVTVCNWNGWASAATTIGVFYDRDETPTAGDTPDATFDLPGLAGRSCATRAFSTQLPSGRYDSWAVVDPFGQLAETNEGNNVAGPRQVRLSNAGPCEAICDTLTSPCGLVGSGEQAGCQLVCGQQSDAAIDCAHQAAQRRQCLAIVSCFIGL